MRRCYLVCYDISDDRRLKKVFKTLKGYGEHWQFSIFFCVLKDIDRVRLQTDLEQIMNPKEDQTLMIDLGPNEEAARSSAIVLGQSLQYSQTKIIVI